MKKIAIFLILIVLGCPWISHAEAVTNIILNEYVQPDYFYSATFDNVAMDFTIKPVILDILNGFTVKNQGNARQGFEIKQLELYQDGGAAGFQGMGIDKKIAVADYDMSSNAWIFHDLNQIIPLTGTRYFVTVETLASGTDARLFQLYIPKFVDNNGNNAWDSGDDGLFLLSNEKLPTDDFRGEISRFKKYSFDIIGPKVVISNLVNGSYFYNTESFLVKGEARDQGAAGVEKVQLCIDNICKDVTNTGTTFSSWSYNWPFISEGDFAVYAKGVDTAGNEFTTEKIKITVQIENFISYKYSKIIFDKSSILANGQDKVNIQVTVKDQFDRPVAGQTVELFVSPTGVVIDKSSDVSNDLGTVNFVTWSAYPGLATYEFHINGAKYNATYNVNFEGTSTNVDYLNGRWIKLAGQAAVYFLDSNSIRHTYPTQKIWESYFGKTFSSVQTISDSEMAGYRLGRNVPFKTGTLMKIPSVPRVYEVGENGLIRWVKTEAQAKQRYGANWATKVNDLSEAFFMDYTEGMAIE